MFCKIVFYRTRMYKEKVTYMHSEDLYYEEMGILACAYLQEIA